MTITIDRIAQLDEAITGTVAATQDREAAPRPYWQDQPCPPWCLMSVPHRDSDMPDDRYHLSVIHHIDLTLEKAIPGPLDPDSRPFLTVQLDRHHRERDPRVILIRNGQVDIPFTIAEAGELAQELTDLASRDSAQDERCPSWCTHGPHTDPYIGDRNHASDYTMVTLTLADPDVSYPPKPWPAGELPEPEVTLPDVGVRLGQGWREREARVDIVYRDEYTDLTLAEARELAEALSGLVADAAV